MPALDIPSAPPRRFTLRSILIVTAALAFTWGLTAHQIRRSRDRLEQTFARRELPSRLAGIGGALRAYGGRNTFLQRMLGRGNPWPPNLPADKAGQPLYSWRLRLASYDASWSLPLKPALNATWDSESNRKFAAAHNPFNINYRRIEPLTQFFAITGPGTAFDPDAVDHYAEVPPATIVVMEVADSSTHWMQPGDYDVNKLLAATGRLGDTVRGFLDDRIHVLFADGDILALSPDTPMDAVKPFLTIEGAKKRPREKELGPYGVN